MININFVSQFQNQKQEQNNAKFTVKAHENLIEKAVFMNLLTRCLVGSNKDFSKALQFVKIN